MPQENTPNAPAAAGDASQNPPAQAAQTPPTNAPAADDNTDTTELVAKSELHKANREAASLRQRLRAYEEAEAKAKDAELSAQQRAEKALTDKTAEYESRVTALQQRVIRASVEAQAARLDFTDPADALALVDRDALELDADGIPTNLDKLLAAIARAKPYLLKSPGTAPTAGPTNPARSQSQSGGAWDMPRYQELLRTPGGYAGLSAADRAALNTWLAQQR